MPGGRPLMIFTVKGVFLMTLVALLVRGFLFTMTRIVIGIIIKSFLPLETTIAFCPSPQLLQKKANTKGG